MSIKQLLPSALRNALRPGYQRLSRRWRESWWSPLPAHWREGRDRALRESDPDALLDMAGSEFGITQVRSEILGLLERLQRLKPRTIVEIGTHKGGNSFLFCHAISSVETVIGVDLCVQNGDKLVHFVRPGQRFYPLHGDSQTAAMRQRVRALLRGRAVDFLFIDGDHRYDGVKADYDLYAPLVRPGGLIALHDIVADHRTRFGKQTGCDAGEVHRFWAELVQRNKTEDLIESPAQDGFGIGVISVNTEA